MVNNDNS